MQSFKYLTYVLCLGIVAFTTNAERPQNTYSTREPDSVEARRASQAFASWAKQYVARPARSGEAAETKIMAEGLRLARERRDALWHVARREPAQVLAAKVPTSLRNLLPSSVQAELETPISGSGDFLVFCEMPSPGARHTTAFQHRVRMNGRVYEAVVYGRRLSETTKFGIPLRGVLVNNVLVVDDQILAEIDSTESPGLTNSIVDLSAAAGPLAGTGPSVLAEMSGRIYLFASREHLNRSEALLEAAESGIRARALEPAASLLERARFPQSEVKAPAPRTDLPGGGSLAKVMVLRVDFPDLPGDPRSVYGPGVSYTAGAVENTATNEVGPYYQNSSYGKAGLNFTVTPKLYRLPRTAGYYASGAMEFELYDDAVKAVQSDYAVADYDQIIVLFSCLSSIPNSQIQFGGLTLIGTSMVWVNGEFDFRVVAHELGHAFGLYHANFWQTSDANPVSDNGYSVEYGDPFDTMAANWGNDHRADFNPWFKYLLHWIGDDQVQTITRNGLYRIFRFDDARATGALALKIAKDADRDYWIGFRRNFSENAGLQHGAYVVWGYHYARQSNLLGLGPVVNQRRDPGLQIDDAFADPAANLTILPVAQGGEAPHEYLDVQINFGAPPMIVRQPESQITLEGQPAEFTIQVTGPPDTHFLWQRKIGGTGEWVGLTDGGSVSGSSSPTLLINPASLGMGGDAFRCVLSNSAGGFNCSRAVNLAVSSLGVSTLAGQAGVQGAADGPIRLAQFNSPQGIAVDNGGNVYVADTGNQVIRKILPGGTVTTLAGSAGSAGSDDGMGNAARFNSPAGVAVDAAGTLYVADQLNSTIRKITVDGSVTTLAGSAGQSGSQDGQGALARFNHPCAIAVDCFGNLYIADTGNNSIREVSADGTVTTLAGATGIAGALDGPTSQASFDRPSGIAVDFEGLVYVSDQGNSTIRRIVPGGTVTTLAGAAHTPGFMDGLNANARFSLPAGLAVDASGIIYVADPNNSTIRQINPSGLVSTVAGVAGTNGVSDGSCSDATFSFPAAVAVDGLGMLYVADTLADTIRLIRAAPPQPPVLHMRPIGDQLVLSWPASAAGFVLETAKDISAAGRWAPVPGAPTAIGCNLFWTNQLPGKLGFFRLHHK